MSWSPVVVLAAAVATTLLRPLRDAPLGRIVAGPLGVAVVAVALGAVPLRIALDALEVVRDPLLFLALAVPLAAALDRLGVFEAIAAVVAGGRHLPLGLWVLAALVTAVLNLDAAVVLLTPLYIRIARLQAYPVEAFAFMPALLACLASHPLPVSNLTNLVVAEQFDLGAADFVIHLGPSAVAAVAIGWWRFRRSFDVIGGPAALQVEPDRRALRHGVPIVCLVLVGFVVGDLAGLPAWVVAAIAWAWAAIASGSVSTAAATLRTVPVDALAIALGLGVVVAGAVPELGLDRLLGADGVVGRAQVLAVAGASTALTNNLPTVLALGPLVDPDEVWALLWAANVVPVFVLTGALSSLLWRDTAAASGVEISARRFGGIGLRIGLVPFVVGVAFVLR
jgi:arsenical pump membrane protein